MKPLRIIVADDEAIIRLGLKTMLTELGHTVTLATNGREALQMIRAQPFDLALLDIQMPFTNGLEAAKAIARKHPLPIVILTAFGQSDFIEQAAELPIQGYLIKPVNERDLAATIGIAVARFTEAQTLAREKAVLQADLETRKIVERAKGQLMQTGLSETEAYQTLQRRAREQRLTLREVAEALLTPPAK
jgi:response regulator NasT